MGAFNYECDGQICIFDILEPKRSGYLWKYDSDLGIAFHVVSVKGLRVLQECVSVET